jgi:hypothetical protein
MKITADLSKGALTTDCAVFPISNKVRTLRDGTRQSYEVIRSIPDDCPYDPMPFPKGLWNITGLDWQKEKNFDPKTYGPVKIITDAWQMVNAWKLDESGDYLKETDRQVKDWGYLLHYSESGTTLGCIRLASSGDAVLIARFIQRFFDQGEAVQLEVV